ncbi:hypothetical protein COT50_01790 [candidate division WWE3 bacterium CG08_land_8_20_14_0_20_41_10]|uniref:Homing endonuclease LAGLIDADG domain-containing protein n=1 Tax=candidate division WWE3 bacterium CG08_land_8_20_14_0_20_41_10 TaxID=1975085 RepID=A0A2H0XC28_UNCKA|nr:MAG: hypothetical protein COT50_01790 [candidate division WWE3 bacterium CG08_land_8_20_14_0_20_41_10]
MGTIYIPVKVNPEGSPPRMRKQALADPVETMKFSDSWRDGIIHINMSKTVLPLSQECREIILGSLLGDGSLKIHQNYVTPRFSFRHSIKQTSYFKWKVSKLTEISTEKNVWLQKPDGFGGAKLRYQSRADSRLTNLFSLVSKGDKKVVTRKWLNQLSPLSLAVWWMDDGSLIGGGRDGVFCTDSFSKGQVEIIRKYLKVVWGLDTSIGEIKRSNNRHFFRLYIRSVEQLKNFFRLIIPHIKVQEMLYKVCIKYKDRELQQRWISEMVALSHFSENDIVRSFR